MEPLMYETYNPQNQTKYGNGDFSYLQFKRFT